MFDKKVCVLLFGIIILTLIAGCTSSQGNAPVYTTPPPGSPSPTTAVPAAVSSNPAPVTVVPAIPLPTTIKDTPLLFTISAPDGYNGTTIRAISSDYIVYKSTIYKNTDADYQIIDDDTNTNYTELKNSVTIFSYSASLDVSQNIKNFIRNSGTEINESEVTYNGLTYTRFDTKSNPYSGTPDETVFFVANPASENEKGYLPELVYSMTPDGTTSQTTFENMVKSFRFYPGTQIGSVQGTETDKPPQYQ